MDLLAGVDELPADLRFVLSVGVFDGLHRGHAQVLRTAVDAARRLAGAPVVLTFEPHPDEVLRGQPPPLLCDPDEKLERLARAGVAITIVQRFDRAFADQPAEAFLRRVARERDLTGVVMTAETAFGRNRAGTREAVTALCPELGFEVVEVPDLLIGGARASSTRLRELVGRAALGEVRRLLGRDYAVVGEVVRGDGRGRGLGFPTANLRFARPVTLARDGIYAVRASWGGTSVLEPVQRADGVASLGTRPTFGGGQRLLEVHLFEFDGDIYGTRLRVEFVRRLRGERKFGSIDLLVRQMERDAARAREALGARPTRRR